MSRELPTDAEHRMAFAASQERSLRRRHSAPRRLASTVLCILLISIGLALILLSSTIAGLIGQL